MSSSIVMDSSPCSFKIDSENGQVQVSRGGSPDVIGLLVERGALWAGTLLTKEQAIELARLLTAPLPLLGETADRANACLPRL
jgi:hypothetical protein